ncbi:MAG: rod shape-determining protein MreD [Bacillota bacterium]|nr:rod shape-determining protein MreD [Bacillota bacterium]
MIYVGLFLLALVSLVLQSTVFSYLAIAGVKPDLLLIAVVFFSFIRGHRHGAVLGFCYGLLEDLVVGRFIGLNALIKMTIGFLVGLTEGKIYKENLIAPGLLVLLASIISGYLNLILLGIAGIPLAFGENFWRTIFPIALYNIGLAPFLYLKFYNVVAKGKFNSR